MVTYNHEKFIAQALQSVIDQKVNFTYEVIIGEDCSTDNTRQIIKEFENRYPDIIKPIYHDTNVGALTNAYQYCYPKLLGKYIACLEGDDYWTDPYKLQKQVDFLETNPDFVICFHNCLEMHEDKSKPDFLYCQPEQKEISNQEDLLQNLNFIPTCSAVFKKEKLTTLPDWFFNLSMGDWILHILNAQYGKIKYINEVMCVHRIHSGGLWSGNDAVKNNISVLNALKVLRKHFGNQNSIKLAIQKKTNFFLTIIYREYIHRKRKKESAKYFFEYLKYNPNHIFNKGVVKDFLKILFL
jgi:glycosyltransferase involved in cell wall biosynthesis